MKQKLLFIFALLCAVAQGAWSQNVVDLSTLTSDYVAQDGDVLTGDLPQNLYLSIADGATVTLSNINIKGIRHYKQQWYPYIECKGDATIILAEGTNNTIISYMNSGIFVGKRYSTLTIKGKGSLYVEGNEECAGIGGNECNIVIEDGNITAIGGESSKSGWNGGAGIGGGLTRKTYETHKVKSITINGGTIMARGGRQCAGIGGGYDKATCDDININGGNITAYGGDYAAGIGSGDWHHSADLAHGCHVTIEGGTITAYGGTDAAGIGGAEGSTGGDIFIYDGDITAFGGDYGAGIGGGDGARGGAIWITGGTVKAYGGSDGAGIGGGEDGNSGSIVINGGNVYAKGAGYGAGIGAGEDGDVDYISINGGTVEADGGSIHIGLNVFERVSPAIGGEDDEDYDHISIGKKLKATDISSSGENPINYAIRDYNLKIFYHLKLEPCDHAGASFSIIDDTKHHCVCMWCGIFDEDHHFYENDKCYCGYGLPTHVVHIYEYGSNYQYYEANTLTVAEGNDFTLPLTAGGPDNYLFSCWVEGEPKTDEGGLLSDYETQYESGSTQTMGQHDVHFKARYELKEVNLASIDEDVVVKDGMVISGNLNGNRKISIADGATVTLRDATILGTHSDDYLWCGINCLGDATIILEGNNAVRGFNSFYPGIGVATGKTLTIQGDGSLDASSNGDAAGIGGSSYYNCGNIVIKGGTIKATGGYRSAGIGAGKDTSCGDITISNKVISVTAIKGEDAPHSIGASDGKTGTITIGKVKTGPISESPYIFYPSLDVSGDMTGDLEAAMGQTFDITFRGRKFIIDSEWNTLCLPFSMNAEQIGNSPLAKGKIVELDTEKTTLSNDVLTIAYKTATEIEAGKPYMVKWVIGEEDESTHIDDPIFKRVTISASAPTAVSAAGIAFTGTFAPLTLASGDKTRLWLDDDVRLRWVSGQDEQVSPTWCYWNLNGLDASTLKAIVVTFDDGSRPIVELMDGMTDFSILSAFGEQEVNASLEGRELSAVQQADGTWQSRAYTLCLPFYAELFGTGCDFTIYSKAEVTQDGELLFTQEMLPFLYPGNAYLIVVNEGTLRLQEEGVTIIDEAKGADDDENGVLLNYEDNQIAGHWLGSLKTISHDEAVSRKAFTLASDGSFQRITDGNPTWQWPAFRAMFCATDLMTADKLTTKYQLDANGVEDEEEDRSLPAPDSYQGDNDGEATGIAPVIHTIDRDGTERWFDLNGRQLSSKPTKKGIYINKGKKSVVK
jgi:hypothetical protein